MIVHDVPASDTWSFEELNRPPLKIRRFLNRSKANALRIPYRWDRVVSFDSTLFHETDRFAFAEGYENRRTNMTFLTGRALSSLGASGSPRRDPDLI